MLGLKNKRKKKKSKLAAMGRRLITVSDSRSIIAEQFRTIRTNIKFAVPDTDLKTILVTSSTPGEGKSTNAANLGVVFAQEGKKVLIVDADMRKPTLHHTFGIFNTVGLSTVLSRQNEFNCAIQETPIVGLFVLPSGPIPPNPTELLSSKTFDTFIEEMKNNYDIIIFDAPPLLSVSDAQVLSHKCDGTLLIIHSNVAEKEDVLKAQSILATSQAKVLGVILNNYKMPRSRKYYYQYYEKEE
ncbi:MAG: CpsD/CapB family tyrosine-protein kinase [Lysinibacillus sp.]